MEVPHILDALVRMQAEWMEMPRLKLTRPQAQRLWNLPNDVCQTALETLIESGFLAQAPDGAYIRHAFLRTSGVIAAGFERNPHRSGAPPPDATSTAQTPAPRR